ncbi:putative dinucleotide-binding enzyme [Microbacterium terrae]|uniref:NADP oxidoreductase coenzyme F420-dependent n=1 Tax=Microbacterium terrae TaxID=69369 RepID=A0A0M2H3Q7_9MICO|nr:diguanylate cyclase [Microbacterium terrae]KJL40913.1 NADP oxidoreductase coenzyme F420-dependent [Microbacterium terrae]MBP1078202.1 putative dinucleotide-binding enzyme [Microbacterium terrae]GLJ97681.1 dinucleotide-binding protein [Microbacterium terrae]
MTSITIFGTGNMGQAIAGVLARGGADIQHIGSGDASATVNGDIVVLAVPHPSLAQIVAAYGEQFAGKTVVDITNPLDFSTFDSLVVPAGSSAAAELQAALPAAKVVKAFNTNFAATLASGTVEGAPTTVLVAGDDADAKAALIAAVQAGGVAAVDAGALSRAHELEAIGFLQLTLAVGEKIGWTGGFALAS